MRFVVIQNKLWAVGIHWSRAQLHKISRQKLIQKARKLNNLYDLMVFRQGQYGFCSSDGNSEWSIARSLAAYIQLPATTSIIGLFAMQDTFGEPFWWVFAREHGRNIGLGDQVFTSQTEAEAEIRSLQELLGETAPDCITCSTYEDSLAWLAPFTRVSLVSRLQGKGRLELIDHPRSNSLRNWGIAIGLCCIVGYGVNIWFNYRVEQNALESARESKAQKDARKNDLLADPAKHFSQSWLQKPLADHVAALCVQNMRELPTVANGWLLDTVSCTEGRALHISWKHEGSADYVALPDNARLQSSKVAVLRLPLSTTAHIPRIMQEHTRLLTEEMGTRHLFQLCQMTGTKLRLSFKPPEKRTIDKVEITAPWVQGTWELSELSGILIEEPSFSQLLAELPGLTLETIAMKNDSWSFKGHIYVKAK